MNALNIIYILIWGIVVPFILGFQFDILMSKERISYARCLLFGYVIYFALFQLLAPEFIIKGGQFLALYYTWLLIVVIFAAAVLIINRKIFLNRVTEPITSYYKALRNHKGSVVSFIISNHDWLEIVVAIGAIFFILFHTFLIGYMMHFDTDDARFVAEALEAFEKNTLLTYHPITGNLLNGPIGEMRKDVYAPYPVFMAVYGKLFKLPPAIAAHTILPFLYVPMSYMAFYLIAKYFFKNDTKSISVSLLLFGVINTFSMETIFSYGWVLLTLVWQGRSLLCTVMIPFMLYLLIPFVTEKEIKKSQYVFLALTGIACCMLSGMGATLIVPMVLSFALAALLVKRDVKLVLNMIITAMPVAVYFVLYSVYSERL